MGIIQEFKDFLKEYKIVGLAVAFILGVSATSLVNSLVNNIIMPLINPLLPGGEWQSATATIGPFVFGWGSFLGSLINFIIIAFVVFLIVKLLAKNEKTKK